MKSGDCVVRLRLVYRSVGCAASLSNLLGKKNQGVVAQEIRIDRGVLIENVDIFCPENSVGEPSFVKS